MSLTDKLKSAYKKVVGSSKKTTATKKGGGGGKTKEKDKKKATQQSKTNKPSKAVQNYANKNQSKPSTTKPTSPTQTAWGSYANSIAQNNARRKEQQEQAQKKKDMNNALAQNRKRREAQDAKRARLQKEAEERRRKSIDKNARLNAETKKQKKEYYGSKDWENQKKQNELLSTSHYRNELKKQGYDIKEINQWMSTEQGKKEVARFVKENKKAMKDATDKSIAQSAKKTVKAEQKAQKKKQEQIARGDEIYKTRSRGALSTTGEVEANQIQGGKAFVDAHNTTAGRVAMGAISAFTPTSRTGETGMAREIYTKEQKERLAKNTDKTSYKVGEFAGNALAFAVPGVAGAKKADAVLKGATTFGGRAGNFVARAGIETAYNTPMNAYQALKGARDENGNLTLEGYAKTLGLNTAMDLGMGAGMNAVMSGADKVLGKRYIDLLAKAQAGKASDKELKQLENLRTSFDVKSKIASNTTANSDAIQNALKDNEILNATKRELPSVTGGNKPKEKADSKPPEWQKKHSERRKANVKAKEDAEFNAKYSDANIERKKSRIEDKQSKGISLTKEEQRFLDEYRGVDSSRTKKTKSDFNRRHTMNEEQMAMKAESDSLELIQNNLDRKHTKQLDELTRALEKVKSNKKLSAKERNARISSLEKQINDLRDRGYEAPAVSRDEVRELAVINAKKESGTATVADKIREAEIRGKVEEANAVKTNLEKTSETGYNKVGGNSNEEIINGRKPDITGTSEGVRGDAIRTEVGDNGSGKRDASITSEGNGRDVLDSNTRKVFASNGKNADNVVYSSNANEFLVKLKENASSQKYGVCVDTSPDLSKAGTKLIRTKSGGVTIGVKPNGDVFGVAKHSGVKDRREFEEAMLSAISNGGNRLDAYGRALANNYARYGFEPVARIPYNPEYVDDVAKPIFEELIAKGNPPDVYVFKHNGDSIENIINKRNNSEYKIWTQDELDNLKTFEDYDEALAYRDSMIDSPNGNKPPAEGGSFNSAKETPNDGVVVKNDGVKKDEVPYRLTADEETYKKANVSTKSLTNMTKEELESELKSLEYVKKNNGKTPKHQRLRDERMKAIRGELLARKKEAMKKPTREMIASADDLENSANGEFRDDVSRLGKETKKATQSFYRLFVDTFSGFEKYASTLPKEMRTEVQSAVNSLRNARNKAGGWVTEGRVLDGKVVGKPLKDIMGDLLKKGNSEKYLAFQDYAFNLHNIDRANSGKEVFGGVSAEESKAIVDELARKYPEFENIQKEINDYFKDLQQYRVETGLASKDTVDYLDALYPNYVPTYRLREPAPANDFAKGNASVDQIYKVAKGGDQKVIPLHEQITNQTEYTLKMGEQNRLFSTIAKMQGFEAKDIDPNVTINDAVQASLIPVRTTDGATYKHKVTFFDNGEPKTVEINQQMYDGILEWRKDKATLVDMFNWKSKPLRGMQRANSLFKNLITGWNPLFGVTNIVKDTGEALLYTKNVFGFIKSYPKAVSQVLRKGEYFKLYEANGGKYAHLRDVLTTFDTSKLKKWSNPIQWCQSFNDTLEAIPRMAEFISTVDKHTNGDLSKMDSKIANEALMNANEVTLNFGRKGIYGQAMNSTAFPYLNPAIQGVDKLRRVFMEAGTDGVKGIASLSAKIATFAVAPAVANEIFMENFGGQAYQDLNSRDKDNFFFIPMGDGKFIKIPKSRVGSALASPAMHLFRYAQYGDDMEWKQMFETAWDNVGVANPLESSLFSPLALAYMNKTWYGGSIESMSDADLRAVGEAGKIYDSTTSAIAIWIGGKTNISPKKIDYIIDAYTGVIGDIALPYTAEASQGNPLAKKFIMDSVFSNDLSTTFWDKNASMEAMSKVKGGKNTDKYNDWKSTYMYDALTLNDAVKAIDADKNLTKAEKAKLKRGIKIQLNNVYRSAVNGEPCDVEPISVISDAIGADKALSMYLPTKKKKSGTDTWGDYYNAYKKSTDYKNLTPKQREANAKKFLNVYSKGVEVQKAIDATDYHDRPDWGTTGVVIAELQKQGKLSKKQANTISESCGVWESSMKAYGKYMKFDGNTKRYVVTQKRLNKMYESLEIDTGTGIWKGSFGKGGVKGGAIAMQLSTSKVEFADRAYYISNYSDENMMLKMNASRGFAKKYGHTTEELIKMANKADKKGDSNTYLSQGEVRDYCDNMKGNNEEKAMAFILLGGNPKKNPYGSIGDYSSKRDTGITADAKESSGGGGRRRGGYGHHGGGGGGKGAKDWYAWLKEQGLGDGTGTSTGTSVKMKNNTSESALNDAYRKRVRKLMTNK